jgi:hypothetical protein
VGREEARCTTSVRPEHFRVWRLLSDATAGFDAICDFMSLRQMRDSSVDLRLFRRTYPTPPRSWAWEGFSPASIYVDTVHGEQEDQASEEQITSEWLVSEVCHEIASNDLEQLRISGLAESQAAVIRLAKASSDCRICNSFRRWKLVPCPDSSPRHCTR